MYPYHSNYSQESYTNPGFLEDSYNPYEWNEYYVTENPLRPQYQPQPGIFGPQYVPQGPSQGLPVQQGMYNQPPPNPPYGGMYNQQLPGPSHEGMHNQQPPSSPYGGMHAPPPVGQPYQGPHTPPFHGGPPTAPPPLFVPQLTHVPVTAIHAPSMRRCLYRNTYVWLMNGRRFWFYPTYVGSTSVAGYRWSERRQRWAYFGIDASEIRSFQCF